MDEKWMNGIIWAIIYHIDYKRVRDTQNYNVWIWFSIYAWKKNNKNDMRNLIQGEIDILKMRFLSFEEF